jgi:heavy metal sensor kinase
VIRSIRGRLLIALFATGSVLLVCLFAAMYFSIHQKLSQTMDAAILSKAQAVTAMCEQDAGEVNFDFDAEPIAEFLDNPLKHRNKAFFEIRLENGAILGRSPSLRDADLALAAGATRTPMYDDVILPGGRPGRSITFAFVPVFEGFDGQQHAATNAAPRTAVIVVAQETEELLETLHAILIRMIAGGVAALAISGGLTVWIIRRSLRPMRVLAARIDALSETQQGQRIALERAPVELQPVVATLNALLARMDAAMARERGFTADVAHELRTPLTALRTTLEVSQGRVRTPEEYAAVIRKCLDLGNNVQSMIETLLLLARADAGQLAAHPRAIDIVERVDEWFIPFEPQAAARGISVRWEMPDAGQVITDPDLLQIIVNNLFDNAVSYAPEGGKIEIRGVAAEGHFAVSVANTGGTLSPQDATRVFDRFWRGDPARADVRRHHGLGLSLSKQAAELLGHKLAAEITPDGQFRISLIIQKVGATTPAGDTPRPPR